MEEHPEEKKSKKSKKDKVKAAGDATGENNLNLAFLKLARVGQKNL